MCLSIPKSPMLIENKYHKIVDKLHIIEISVQ